MILSKFVISKTVVRWIIFTMLVTLLVCGACFAEEPVRYDQMEPGKIEATLYVGMGTNFKYPSATRHIFKFDVIGARVSRVVSPRTAVGVDVAMGTGMFNTTSPQIWSSVSYQQYLWTSADQALSMDLSIGLMRFRNKVPELGSRVNFTERVGFTYKWKSTADTAWTAQWTLSHISNAGLKVPNIGINACSLTFGHSWYR